MKKKFSEHARLKMIEKSELYKGLNDSHEVYQYGFYDGYTYAQEILSLAIREALEFGWLNSIPDGSEKDKMFDNFLMERGYK